MRPLLLADRASGLYGNPFLTFASPGVSVEYLGIGMSDARTELLKGTLDNSRRAGTMTTFLLTDSAEVVY